MQSPVTVRPPETRSSVESRWQVIPSGHCVSAVQPFNVTMSPA